MMNLNKAIKAAALALSLMIAGSTVSAKQAAGELETITCTWPNGDHWSITTNDYDYGSELIDRCVREGGFPGFQPA